MVRFVATIKNLELTIKIKDAAKILHHAPQLCQQNLRTMDTLFKRTIPHVLPCGQNLDLWTHNLTPSPTQIQILF